MSISRISGLEDIIKRKKKNASILWRPPWGNVDTAKIHEEPQRWRRRTILSESLYSQSRGSNNKTSPSLPDRKVAATEPL